MTATQAPAAFVVAPIAPPPLTEIAARLGWVALASDWRGEVLDIARELQALAIPGDADDSPAWGILTTRPVTAGDTRQQQAEGAVRIASLTHPVTYAKAQGLVALFQSDPYQTARYQYRILPFDRMTAEANA